MIKNHPFQNGNKRIAVMTLLVALSSEDKWLDTSWQDLYEFAIIVADSKPKTKNITLSFIEFFIDKNTVPYK